MEKKRVVIIGNSAAGLAALETFRKKDQESKITLIDREPYPAYSRVITPYFIMGGIKGEEGLFLRDKNYYKSMGVRTLFGTEVLGIDTQKREVLLDQDKKEPFDLLLIATGSSPIRPKIRGIKKEEIGVLRNLDHAKHLKDLKPKVQKVLFLGGGLVSLQTLQALYRKGGQYTIVVKSHHLLSQILDQEASEFVERHLEKIGIRLLKSRDVVQLRRKRGTKIAILDNGEEMDVDFIFAGKGVEPNIQFLKRSKIQTQRGILVNHFLETNLEGIYAAGDVAEAPDFFTQERVLYGLWPSAIEQGELVGRNMAGERGVYPGNLRMNVTRIFGLPIASIGDFRSSRVGEVLIKKDEKRGHYRKLCLDQNGVLIGALLINQVEDLGVLHGLIRERKSGEILKSKALWRSPIHYGFLFKTILQGRM
jgi:NAD(P)H-nitrite reductase large subunit